MEHKVKNDPEEYITRSTLSQKKEEMTQSEYCAEDEAPKDSTKEEKQKFEDEKYLKAKIDENWYIDFSSAENTDGN